MHSILVSDMLLPFTEKNHGGYLRHRLDAEPSHAAARGRWIRGRKPVWTRHVGKPLCRSADGGGDCARCVRWPFGAKETDGDAAWRAARCFGRSHEDRKSVV